MVEPITAPYPSYLSLHTALHLRGMIEQIPEIIYAVSLTRTRVIRTRVGTFSIHHLAPELFGGFETRADGSKLATAEKTLFDFAYLSGGRTRAFTRLTELELPRQFDARILRKWVSEIASARHQTMVLRRLQAWLPRLRLPLV